MAELEARDPERAARVRERAQAAMERLRPEFPGNADLGIVDENAPEFDDFANDEPCPALDPQTGFCDLYASRPMTCRVFGAPLRTEDGVGVCELCFHGATNEEIAACELRADTAETETELIAQAEADSGKSGSTVVAFALAAQPSAWR
jgi:Fe-S-cluster containining protein